METIGSSDGMDADTNGRRNMADEKMKRQLNEPNKADEENR